MLLTALLQNWCPSRALVTGRDTKQIKLFFIPLPELSKHWTTNVKSSLILIKQNPSATFDEFDVLKTQELTGKTCKHSLARCSMDEGWSWESYCLTSLSVLLAEWAEAWKERKSIDSQSRLGPFRSFRTFQVLWELSKTFGGYNPEHLLHFSSCGLQLCVLRLWALQTDLWICFYFGELLLLSKHSGE